MDNTMDKLVSLCKRRGFVFPSSEIYGGINACWDYGPLGTVMKNNVKAAWWRAMTQLRDDIEALDAAILMHPKVWEASGHIENFTDPLVDCKQCKARYRTDELKGDPTDPETVCPKCGNRGTLTEPRLFNLMFKTFMGPVQDDASVIYLRPETAQGIYVNFDNVRTTSRQKIPFGIAQIGKAFRNEITPGNFIFRTREFEQMEMQFFVKPSDDEIWFEHWKQERYQWYLDLGIRKEKLRFHEHGPNDLAHYAKKAYDVEYEFPFGWKELEGIHNRTDFDLGRHQKYSGKKLEYFDDANKERYIPYIIETSAGCDRTLLTCLVDAYREDEVGGEKRVYLSLHPRLAPIKAAVFPLVKRDGMPETSKEIVKTLRKDFPVFYDEAGAVGRRYRRQDEAGTPFCITVDSQTKEDETVTIRYRDTLEQERCKIADLPKRMKKLIWV
ncbi:MAG: glycine--tRNA ligase [Candidatus Eisenbacteria bacterium]|uniref:Glycine--tRNA ligase n=1 Tax=Eiseniibacteriota bacterium TaxID=2212470 RepID=A0A948W4U8_UNCEI|nr:glycine--tRNA ligase [Candidatus Eisenbacteria bacterium]MBU1950590.1 glycine--tRNA ligase [Candidatus Eisenbacteria bacterium]MBU2692617.1 glycine--tRNA ligase [Candidatus Eisenbacteria bacterium]